MPLAKPTKPDAITAVPTPVPLRTDRANFAARGDAMMGWFPGGVDEINDTSDYMDDAANFSEQEANEAEASATAAEAANVASAVNAAAAAASAGAVVWVTGTTYAAGVVRYSPTNFQTYRDTAGGLSSTDPASDTTGRWISAMLPSAEAIGLPNLPPTAVFNFASGVIDRRFVESRSTDGTRYNIFGNLETLAAGVAKPTYDPATKEAKGYLAEPATTYIAMRSSELDNATYWPRLNVSVTASAGVSAAGDSSAFKLQATGAGLTYFIRSLTATATAQYAFVRAKKGSGATECNDFRLLNLTTATVLASLTINYDTGVITQTTGSGATAEPASGGAWDIRIPATSGITVSDQLYIYVGFVDATTVGGEHAYFDTPTISDKPGAMPYPTAGSNVTTVAGGLTMDLTAHNEVINPRGFTVVCAFDGDPLRNYASGGPRIIASFGSTASDYISITEFGGALFFESVVSSAPAFTTLSLGSIAAGRNVVAISLAPEAARAVLRGGAVQSASPATLAATPTLHVGGSGGANVAATSISLVVPFPRACNANELLAFVNNF